MGLSLEKKLLNQTEKELKQKGLPIVKSGVKIGRSGPDLVGYTLNDEGNEEVQVVVEIKEKPNPSAQQQLMKYVQGIKAPYALLVFPDNQYWFDGNTFLPTDEPEFESKHLYLTKDDLIEKTAWEALEGIRGYLPSEQYGKVMAHTLLVRTYLSEHGDLDKWVKIEEFQQFKELLFEASKFYEIDIQQVNYDLQSEQLVTFLNKISVLPPVHSALRQIIMKCLEVNKPIIGQFNAPPHLRELYVGLVQQLDFKKDSVVDLASGYGSIAFDVIGANNIKRLIGFEIYQDTCTISKIMSIVSGINAFEVNCKDSIRENEELQANTFSLTLLDPPLGLKYNLPEELHINYKLAQKRVDASDLFIEKAITVTQPGGYIVMLVPESVLFSEKFSITRDFIKEKSIIETIVSLPTHTLKPYASVKVSVLVLRKKKEANESADEIFLARADSVEDFKEIVGGFSKWKKGGLPNG
ncbi:HsdM family class I SAM-dependent methyltransferase [Rossellomorea vietnamensis]|uniref:site-specific DNA-methyltransferase (adenine-specific) n=1 Tax=Rossellomorea vietnamensis TaxID=218284 RepID=A0A0P6WNL0_9BACI|nr:N-6 DNA methylase [Rossellomorea vietnamensis]KPL57822.1 hypothetical protein AM506_19930 [Rossellomorea vietnamensis]